MKLTPLIVSVLLLVSAAGFAAEAPPARTDWFHRARWGVFVHYLTRTELNFKPEQPDDPAAELRNVEAWNEAIDRFDVEGLADQLAAVHAGYFVITLGQNSGYYLSPNAAYDRLVGRAPSRLARRDLVADLAKALEKRHIPLMVYLPSGAPDRDRLAMSKLSWQKGPHRNAEFQRMWEQVIREWSVRWGKSVRGWWFDGCYWAGAMYPAESEPNFTTFAAAARAGNPDAILAFNSGTRRPFERLCPEQDYTAGEANDPLKLSAPGRAIDGMQAHVLSYLGKTWGASDEPRFTDAQLIDWTKRFAGAGGVVSWDVHAQRTGRLAPREFQQLEALGRAMQAK